MCAYSGDLHTDEHFPATACVNTPVVHTGERVGWVLCAYRGDLHTGGAEKKKRVQNHRVLHT